MFQRVKKAELLNPSLLSVAPNTDTKVGVRPPSLVFHILPGGEGGTGPPGEAEGDPRPWETETHVSV